MQYIVQSQIRFHGFDPSTSLIKLEATKGELYDTEDIIKYIEQNGDSIELILLPGVQYYTGQLFDMERITAAGHKKGCKVGWDLAHAVGNVPLQLHQWNVDFACWCSYKYLNSGPGGIGGCFVHSMHSENKDIKRFAAWWGHDYSTRFAMTEPEFHPIPGAFGFRVSNPPVICIAALLASVEIFKEADIARLRKKSLLLTGYLELLIYKELKDEATIITPKDTKQRGCQLSLVFKKEVTEVSKALQQQGVICDVRKPHVLRVSPVPLYNTFSDVQRFINILKNAL